jgi:CRISPR-associated endonuclease/helicase Cas3
MAHDVPAAHSRNADGHRHPLVDHLRGVAATCAEFGLAFGASELCNALGLLHDLGKFHPDFQRYLDECDRLGSRPSWRVDHKGAGATFAERLNPILPLVIMAHHGGLRTPGDLREWLHEDTIAARVSTSLARARQAMPELSSIGDIALPDSIRRATDAELFVRMLFSCLVDADFLDTESHFAPERTSARATEFDPAGMLRWLHDARAQLAEGRHDALTRLRSQIAEACEAAGTRPPGLYRMTVPTGGGKTLAGIGFALRHAVTHHKRRVVVAIPFTSITEQTAATYRDIFGAGAVLEHHSAIPRDERDDDDPTAGYVWQRLAAENWDAPIVVTTTVQLFESLLGNRVSTSRKLHNLADSVLILDEVQMLPTKHLDPILDVLRTLVERFGTTVLLSTATQPDFTHAGLGGEEIAPDPAHTFNALRRVRYHFEPQPWSWHEAARRIAAERQAMMVLNTKKDAVDVLDALAAAGIEDGVLHLSANLCGAHRHRRLAEVRDRLKAGEACRLISTQVVEAGVDIDFPVVYRAMGPLDRIIQAAGRCNREARLDAGRVVVFRPAEGGLPPGAYRTATQLSGIDLDRAVDLDDPYALAPWFRRVYGTVERDAEGIQKLREKMHYPEVARKFRMIQDDTEEVVVPYGDAAERAQVDDAVAQLRTRSGTARLLLRMLQSYTVGLRRRAIQHAASRGFVQPIIAGVWEWTGPPELYDDVRGLIADGADEELLIDA